MTEENTKKRQRRFDRVTLGGDALDRVDSWIKQAESAKPGVSLSRKDLINWLVKNLPEQLSPSQTKGLAEEFYSELRYLSFAAREIKAAQARGEKLTLKEIEQNAPPTRDPSKPRRVRQRRFIGGADSPDDVASHPPLNESTDSADI